MRKFFLTPILVVLFTICDVFAQEQERPVPPTRETQIPATDRIDREEPQRERLPEFELPEYIITGRAIFRLPYVQKPKFNEQNIFIAEVSETMTGVDRDIETSPIDVPTKSFGEFSAIPSMQHGQVRIGFGLFNTPVVSGWANLRTDDWDVSGRLYYMNTEGYEPFARGYDVDGFFKFGYRIPQEAPAFFRGGKPYLSIGFEGVKYGLMRKTEEDELEFIDRVFRSNFSEIGFRSGADAPFEFDFILGWRGSTLDDETDPIPRPKNDNTFYTQLNTLGYIQSLRFRTDIRYTINTLDFETDAQLTNPSHRFFKGTIMVFAPIFKDFLMVEFGGNYYSIRDLYWQRVKNTDVAHGGSIDTDWNKQSISLKPIIELRVMPSKLLTVYGRFAPEIINHSVYSFQQMNPYIFWVGIPSDTMAIESSDEKINAIVGTEITPHRQLSVHAFAQYRKIESYPSYLIHIHDHYKKVNLTYLGVTKLFSVNTDVRLALSDRDILTTQVSLRYSTNDYFDTSVPYVPPIEIAAIYMREFPFGLRTSVGFEYLSPRRASYWNSNDDELGKIINLNLEVQYQFHNIMGVYVKLDNIINQSYERYFTYPSRPFYIEGGIQISF